MNMLVNPGKRDHEIGWHRDLVSTELPPDKEQTALMQVVRSVQWNTALYDEACLYIVPGSHTRVSTDEARDIVKNWSFDAMPGQIAVELKAGQGVYYNANLLHRGKYPKDVRRETVHACMGTIQGAEMRKDLYRWLAWMTAPDVRGTLPEGLHPLYDNFIRMAEAQERAGGRR